MIYAWGFALFLSFLAYEIDKIETIPDNWKPGVGVNTCFLKSILKPLTIQIIKLILVKFFLFFFFILDQRFTKFLYFYLPACIIFTINVIFFICTAIKILRVQQDLSKITSQEESSRHQNNIKQNKDK